MMAQYFGLHASEVVAAIGCQSGNLLVAPPSAPVGFEPMGVAIVHGTADSVVRYDEANAAAWAAYNGCSVGGPAVTNETAWAELLYTGCAGGVEVMVLELPGVGHASFGHGTTPAVWTFVSAYERQGVTLSKLGGSSSSVGVLEGEAEDEAATVVLWTATASGNLADLSASTMDEIHASIASAAGVALSHVTVRYAAGSIEIYAVVTVPPGSTASAVASRVNSNLGTAAVASSTLSLVIETVALQTTTATAAEQVSINAGASLPTADGGESIVTIAAAAGGAGGGVLLLALLFLAWYCHKLHRSKPVGSSEWVGGIQAA